MNTATARVLGIPFVVSILTVQVARVSAGTENVQLIVRSAPPAGGRVENSGASGGVVS